MWAKFKAKQQTCTWTEVKTTNSSTRSATILNIDASIVGDGAVNLPEDLDRFSFFFLWRVTIDLQVIKVILLNVCGLEQLCIKATPATERECLDNGFL